MLASVLRNRIFNSQAKFLAVRAPKKKKDAKVEAPLNKDIINIWKDRTDALIYPSDMYPPFVMGML